MARKRRIYKQSEIDEHLDNFSEFSGSKSLFCKENKISIHTFTKWERNKKVLLEDSFMEIELPEKIEVPTIKCGSFLFSNFENLSQSDLTKILKSLSESYNVSASSK